MIPVVGVYKSRVDAEEGVVKLRAAGVPADRINILEPHPTQQELASVPTVGGEQPGILKAIGSVTGGAVGFGLGTAMASLLVPGLGPILAIGAVGGTVLGALAGATAGGIAGNTTFAGLPDDEFFIYEDALRQGRTVVVAMAADSTQANATRNIFTETEAESVDRARQMWWLGLRDIEKEHYNAQGGNFREEEKDLQRGFEAAQHPDYRGRSYENCQTALATRYPDTWNSAAFRKGFERGCKYYEERRKPKAGAAR
jgi:hypothetical protein